MFWHHERERLREVRRATAAFGNAIVGYPSADVIGEAANRTIEGARRSLRTYARHILPWLEWGEEGEDHEVPDWADDMIIRWYQRFRPDQLDEYLARRQQEEMVHGG